MTVIMHILIAIVAAKIAAELAERVKVPAVVGEIIAGLIIGPSALGLLPRDDTLMILGEIGVILLLFDVGLEIDLGELLSVGRAALTVAVIGVVVPFVLGFGVGLAFDMSGNEALFVGAALTATSVGITARVFGDLHALAMVEARTVLGAAVADDVIGLVILTVVVRLVTKGSISAFDVGQVVVVALVFLVGASLIGVRLVPPVFEWLARNSRASGTLMVFGLALALALSKLAELAKLAPIVGAFVAGISLSRSKVADRVHRELTPLGQLLIPVFFLQIGVDADVGQFVKPAVLGLAAALLAVAIIGKLVSAVGLIGSPGDRMLVGMAMIPRGEVGLIFATIGLQESVFGNNVDASVLLVVLATTLLTPPLLRWRLLRMRAGGSTASVADGASEAPPGGWFAIEQHASGSRVDLVQEPDQAHTLEVALQAALLADAHTPGPGLFAWLSAADGSPLVWTAPSREAFLELLRSGGPRAWRFVTMTGVLDRSLPELGAAVAEQQAEAYEFDPIAHLDWATLAAARESLAGEDPRSVLADHVLLAALAMDATDDDPDRSATMAAKVADELGLGRQAATDVGALLRDLPVFVRTAHSVEAFDEDRDLELASRVGSSAQVRALEVLARAENAGDVVLEQRVRELADHLLSSLDQI